MRLSCLAPPGSVAGVSPERRPRGGGVGEDGFPGWCARTAWGPTRTSACSGRTTPRSAPSPAGRSPCSAGAPALRRGTRRRSSARRSRSRRTCARCACSTSTTASRCRRATPHARDAARNETALLGAKSDVNIEYQTEQIARRIANGEDVAAEASGLGGGAMVGAGGAGGRRARTRFSRAWRGRSRTTTKTKPPSARSG